MVRSTPAVVGLAVNTEKAPISRPVASGYTAQALDKSPKNGVCNHLPPLPDRRHGLCPQRPRLSKTCPSPITPPVQTTFFSRKPMQVMDWIDLRTCVFHRYANDTGVDSMPLPGPFGRGRWQDQIFNCWDRLGLNGLDSNRFLSMDAALLKGPKGLHHGRGMGFHGQWRGPAKSTLPVSPACVLYCDQCRVPSETNDASRGFAAWNLESHEPPLAHGPLMGAIWSPLCSGRSALSAGRMAPAAAGLGLGVGWIRQPRLLSQDLS